MRFLKRGRYKYLIVLSLCSFCAWSLIFTRQPYLDRPLDVEDFNYTEDAAMLTRTEEMQYTDLKDDSKEIYVVQNLNTTRPLKEEVAWKDAVLLAGNDNRHGEMTIGIPTMYRANASYLHTTLKSIISNLSEKERQNVVCVIFLSGNNATYARHLASNLSRTFPSYVKDGFIRLIQAPEDYYPSMRDLKQTYNDKMDRVKWRSKQNLDYAFLIHYCRNISTYYLQIEDDVLVAQDFYGKIMLFVQRQKKNWAMLDYSGRGFIGKLFKSRDLPKLAHLLRAFFDEQPCDFLINYFSSLLIQPKAIVRKPSLFKHIGYYSTLKDQIRKLDWSGLSNNPTGKVNTSIETYEKYHLRNVYESNTKFWGKFPIVGDTVDIMFDKLQRVKKILIQTGDEKKPGTDRLESGVLEAGTDALASPGIGCATYKHVANFDHGNVLVKPVPAKAIRCIRIRVTETQENWLIIRKIDIVKE